MNRSKKLATVLLFFVFAFPWFDSKASVLDDIFSGKINSSYLVTPNSLQIPNPGDKQGYFLLQETLFLLGEEAAVFNNFSALDAVYRTIDELLNYDLGKRYFSGNSSIGSTLRMKLALVNDSFSLADPRFTPEQKLETISSFKKIKPNSYLSNGELIAFYVRIMDFYVSQGNYIEAENYSLIALATASNQKSLFTNDIVKLLSRIFMVQAYFGKRQNLFHVGKLFDEIISSYSWSDAQGSTLLSYSNLMTAAVELGSFEYAELISKVIFDLKNQGVQIPEYVRFIVEANNLIMKAWSGKEIRSDYFEIDLSQEQKKLPQMSHLLDALEVFSKVNKSAKLQSNDLKKMQAAAEFSPASYAVFEKIVHVVYYAQNNEKLKFAESLVVLRDFYFEYQKTRTSPFEYDKSSGFIHQQIKKTLFNSLNKIFPDRIPENIADLTLEIVTPVSGEVDLQIKATNASLSASNLMLSPQTGLKLRKEFDYLMLSLLDSVRNNFIAFAQNDFTVPKNSQKNDLGFEFIRMLNGLKLPIRRSISAEDLSEIVKPEPIDVDMLKSTLSEGQLLITYQISGNQIFICHLRQNSTDCKIKILKEPLASLSAKLRNSVLESNKQLPFVSTAQFDLYDIFFDKFNLEKILEVKVNPLSNNIGLPFNILRDGKEGSLPIGRQWGITIIPSLIILNTLNSTTEHKGEYFGIGDPTFKVTKDAEQEIASLFTVRSAAMASELSDLSSLPDTTNEILNSAKNFGVEVRKTLLGDEATELNLRLLSFQDYKFIHFATHGLVSGEFEGLRSPGLALTVNPEKLNALNDGYFDAFEISELKLNADIVVLSACQTVSDLGNPNAGFAGLTSAFLNAGARGVLGTQWKIESTSASSIISNFFFKLSRQNSTLTPVVLRDVLNDAFDNGYMHPYYWSPFVYVSALTTNKTLESDDVFKLKKEIFTHYDVNERLEFTGLDSFGGEVWGTYWKTKFVKESRATNYIFELKNEDLKSIETPYGSLKIINQDKNKILLSATYKVENRTFPAIFEFDKNSREFNKIIDFENDIKNETVSVFKDIIFDGDNYFITIEGFSEVESDNSFETTLWSLFKVDADFKEVNKISLINLFEDTRTVKDRLLLNEGIPHIALTYFPTFDGDFDFSKNEYDCTSYSTEFFQITDDFEFVSIKTLKGDLRSVETEQNNSLLTFVDICSGNSVFRTLNEKTLYNFPNYAAEASFAKLIDINDSPFLLGHGDYRSSHINDMFNYIPIAEKELNNFWENRDYIIAEDISSVLFLAPIKDKVIRREFFSKTSRMTSFISGAAVNDNTLFLVGTIDRDRAFLWKVPATALK